jgi:TPR repeat protein
MQRTLSVLSTAIVILGLFGTSAFAQTPAPAPPPGAAEFAQGWKLDQGIGTSVNTPDAIRFYREAAANGNVLARARLARIYQSGNGVVADPMEATRFANGILPDLVKLAQANDPTAEAILGSMCVDGLGVAQDPAVGLQWLLCGAHDGSALAQYYLGVVYENGEGVAPNWSLAAQWYGKAANQGNAISQAYLGDMYRKGQGVPQSDAEAIRLYKLAVAQNQMHAETNLGWMYQYGCGVPQNSAEAARLYRLAADQNFAIAETNLGVCYEDGCGVPQDVNQAILWYRRAAAQGDRIAIRALRRLGC